MAPQPVRGNKAQGKKSFQRKRQPDADARAAVRGKKAYHHVKLLQKALKKAKQFEVQKITRRQKDAGIEPAAAQKLALQLEAVKQLDLIELSQQAGAQYGLVSDPKPARVQPDTNAPASSLPSALSLMAARLLAAKCVRDAGQAASKDLLTLDAAAAAAAAKVAAAAAAVAAAVVTAEAAVTAAADAQRAGGEAGLGGSKAVKLGDSTTESSEGDEGIDGEPSGKRRRLDDGPGARALRKSAQNPDGSLEGGSDVDGGSSDDKAEGFGSDSEGSSFRDDNDLDNVSEVSMSDDEGNNDTSQRGKRAMLLMGPDPNANPAPDAEPSSEAKQNLDRVLKGDKKRPRSEGTGGAAELVPVAIASQAGIKSKAENAKKQKVEKKLKNRLGQRARRKLAEEQFGASARHVAEAALEVLPPPPPPGARGAVHATGSAGAGKSAADSESLESLHPSWVAKRQQKDMLAAAPQGTRVVFGDDGAIEQPPPPAAVTASAISAVTQGGVNPGVGSRGGEYDARAGDSAGRRLSKPRVAGGMRSGVMPKPIVEVVVPQVVVKDRVRFRAEAAPERVFGGRGGGRGGAGGRVQLHPSWEAKKLQRQQMEHLLKPEGSKVVFEDSD